MLNWIKGLLDYGREEKLARMEANAQARRAAIERTRANAARFRHNAQHMPPCPDDVDPALHEAQRQALLSMAADLEQQAADAKQRWAL